MRNPIAWLALCSAITLVGGSGCGGRTSTTGSGGSDNAGGSSSGNSGTGIGGASSGGSGGSGTGGTGGSSDCRRYTSPASCAQNPTGQLSTPSLDEFRAAISQRWLLCGTTSIFGNNRGDIGLEITPEGLWYRLYRGAGGSAVRGAGFDEEGKWDTVTVGGPGDPQPYQLNFHILASGMIYTRPTLATTPRAMRLDNNGVLIANYVLDPGVPSGGARCP